MTDEPGRPNPKLLVMCRLIKGGFGTYKEFSVRKGLELRREYGFGMKEWWDALQLLDIEYDYTRSKSDPILRRNQKEWPSWLRNESGQTAPQANGEGRIAVDPPVEPVATKKTPGQRGKAKEGS